jgi:hypothetical protein
MNRSAINIYNINKWLKYRRWAVPSMFILSIPEGVRLHAGLMSLDIVRSLQCLAWLENCLHEENGRFHP